MRKDQLTELLYEALSPPMHTASVTLSFCGTASIRHGAPDWTIGRYLITFRGRISNRYFADRMAAR